MSIHSGVEAAGNLIQGYSAVHNSRRDVYKRKAEIVKTPMVREIIHAVVNDFSHPPMYIEITSAGILTRPYDNESGTYHPNGIVAYVPELVFDWQISAALCLIIQDMYPDKYDFPSVSIDVLNEQLINGTWSSRLNLKQEYMSQSITPTFNIDEIATIPLEQLPIEHDDPKSKGYKKLPTVSLWLGIASLALCWFSTGVSMMASVAGIITGIIGVKTSDKKKKAIAGIVMSLLGGFVLPFVIAIISFQSWLNSGFGLF